MAVLAFGAAYAVVVPIGEAPDERAHLAYVTQILEHHTLPPLAAPPYGDQYEFYQAPLDYAVTAMAARIFGLRSLDRPWHENPSFSFFDNGSRAYLRETVVPAAEGRIRWARIARLPWALVTALLVLATAQRLSDGRTLLALSAVTPFVLAPQFLLVSATINNDSAVVTFASLAIFGLVRLLDSRRPLPGTALLSGCAAGLAAWGKVSGFLLGVPLCFVVGVLCWRRWHRSAALLGAGMAALSALWIVLVEQRFGCFWPPSPTVPQHILEPGRLLNPQWVGSLWVSYWAKFGWLNLRLPAIGYAFFVVPTTLVVLGCVDATRAKIERFRLWRWLFVCTAGANVSLVAAFLLTIDWQIQGRFLFPSLPALAGLAVLGLRVLADHPATQGAVGRRAPALLIVAALAMAAWGLVAIRQAYF